MSRTRLLVLGFLYAACKQHAPPHQADMAASSDFGSIADLLPSDLSPPDLSPPDLSEDLSSPKDLSPPPDLVPPPPYFIPDFPSQAFDVAADGSAVAVGEVNGQVKAICFAADGSTTKSTFTVHSYDATKYTTFFGIDVARAGTSHQTAITWNYGNFPNGSPDDWQTWVTFLDASCAQIGTAHLLDPSNTVGVNRVASVRMGNDGKSAFVYEAQTANAYRLLIYNADGTNQTATSVGPGICANGALGRAIGMRRTTDEVVVACEGGNGTRYYQRFNSNGTAIDAMPVAATQLHTLNNSFGIYLLVDYDDNGAFAFAADIGYGTSNKWVANFYSSAGLLVSTTPQFGNNPPSNDRILLPLNGDFVTPVMDGAVRRQRYTSSGTLVSTATDGTATLRLDGSDVVYQLLPHRLQKNPFPL